VLNHSKKVHARLVHGRIAIFSVVHPAFRFTAFYHFRQRYLLIFLCSTEALRVDTDFLSNLRNLTPRFNNLLDTPEKEIGHHPLGIPLSATSRYPIVLFFSAASLPIRSFALFYILSLLDFLEH